VPNDSKAAATVRGCAFKANISASRKADIDTDDRSRINGSAR